MWAWLCKSNWSKHRLHQLNRWTSIAAFTVPIYILLQFLIWAAQSLMLCVVIVEQTLRDRVWGRTLVMRSYNYYMQSCYCWFFHFRCIEGQFLDGEMCISFCSTGFQLSAIPGTSGFITRACMTTGEYPKATTWQHCIPHTTYPSTHTQAQFQVMTHYHSGLSLLLLWLLWQYSRWSWWPYWDLLSLSSQDQGKPPPPHKLTSLDYFFPNNTATVSLILLTRPPPTHQVREAREEHCGPRDPTRSRLRER